MSDYDGISIPHTKSATMKSSDTLNPTIKQIHGPPNTYERLNLIIGFRTGARPTGQSAATHRFFLFLLAIAAYYFTGPAP